MLAVSIGCLNIIGFGYVAGEIKKEPRERIGYDGKKSRGFAELFL